MTMKRWKRILSGILAVVTAVSLGGCAQETDKKDQKEGETNASKGRYMETVINTPEGKQRAMEVLEDGTLRVVTTAGVFDSKDKGETWSPWENMDANLKEDFTTGVNKEYGYEYDKIGTAAVGKDGTVFYGISQEEKDVYMMIAPDGTGKELQLEPEEAFEGNSSMVSEGSSILEAVFTGKGDLLCSDSKNIYQVDTQSLAVKHQYQPMGDTGNSLDSSEGFFVDGSFQYTVAGDKLFTIVEDNQLQEGGNVVISNIEVTVYSLETFESEGKQKVLEEFLMSEEGGNGELFKKFMSGTDAKSLYFVNPTGIYRYQTEGTTVEKIFMGSLGKMSAPTSRVAHGIVMEDENFILYYAEENELICYNYDPEVPSTPEKELKIYSLYDNVDIRQIMAAYQFENPNVLVELEVGIKEGEAMTRTDALKTLNTGIMAGEGPDLLLLDGLPLDSYMEKGLLMDIRTVLEETDKSNPLFKNIVSIYEKEDSILAVPTRFSVPVMFGKQDILSKADNLTELADVMETLRAEKPESKTVIGSLSKSLLLLMLLPASSPAWMKEDGTLNQETLEQFVGDMKRIADAQDSPDSLTYVPEDGISLDLSPFMCSTEYVVTEMGFAGAGMSLGHIRTNTDLFAMESMLAHLGDSSYKPMPGQSENIFIPINTVGVSAKGRETETAKDFIRFMLGDAQFIRGVGGIAGCPVNESAFEELKNRPEHQKNGLRKIVSEEGNGSFELNYTWPKEQKFDELKEVIRGLTAPAITDEMIIRTVFEEVNKCFNGDSSVSDTADTILKKVNLYLAE